MVKPFNEGFDRMRPDIMITYNRVTHATMIAHYDCATIRSIKTA